MPVAALVRAWSRTAGLAVAFALVAGSASAQILPWEVNIAEVEAGRLRNVAERPSRQFVLYQLHLGDVRKSDLVETAAQIDRLIESLERGVPSQSIPAAWTPTLRQQLRQLESSWGPLRRIAVAGPHEFLRVMQEFVPTESRRADPLSLGYIDDLTRAFIAESETLLDTYNGECLKTGLEICPTARLSGLTAMLGERATKEAVYVVADIDRVENRKRLQQTIEAYRVQRHAYDANPLFAAVLNPERGVSARAAGELLASLRLDWDAMELQFADLAAGDDKNFDLQTLLDREEILVDKIQRFTAVIVRYASLAYGT
ncbi:MAG: hypothetical protein E4H11_07015 [Myxococcales bacterium]|nr:MAG: hypothetical protein E4H11_07015 [Myxococcales bacterium]